MRDRRGIIGVGLEADAVQADPIEAADDAVFDRPLEKPSRIASTVGEMLAFMPIHVAMHAGQITLIRRSLGRPPLV